MNFSSIVIYLKDLIATIMVLLMMMSPAFGGNGAKYEAENPDELIMSFSAVSDIHVETNNPASYKAFYDILEGVKAGENHDSLVFLGDNVMNGQLLENLFFYLGVRSVMPAEENYVVMGNHDIGNGEGDYNNYRNNFVANNNLFLGNDIDKPYYYKVVNGCYMIFIAPEAITVNTCIMSEEQLSWVEDILNMAKNEEAPVFVFNHHPLYSLEGVEGDALAKLLSSYDKLLYIYGHTHDQLGDDNFSQQGGVNTINLPRSSEVVDYAPGDGVVVEVYEDEILVRGRNFITGEWLGELEFRYPLG
ncbi:MAG: metallophosphoesterase [Acutalibacteraceae bacterium]|nr:metallophosphoesterase [Acutalibacteraceae bacterium]